MKSGGLWEEVEEQRACDIYLVLTCGEISGDNLASKKLPDSEKSWKHQTIRTAVWMA